MHINKGKTIAQCMTARIDYMKNPEKTAGGTQISSFACSPELADHEFLMMRNDYVANTGRHINNEIIAYQLRQSFKPGEVSPEEANQIGYELAQRLTNGEFAFLVSTHSDRPHIHNHIAICAASLDGTKKYRNQIRSITEIAAISDEICRDHGLSIVGNPKNKTVTYDKWQGEKARVSNRDYLRMMIDSALRLQPDGFDALMQLLEEAGCLIKRGAQISIKPPNGKQYVRIDTLGDEYSERALRAAINGEHAHIPKTPRSKYSDQQVELLIDIEKKLREGKGKGYQRWAERHNTNVVSQTIIYLKENHISSYESLVDMLQAKTAKRNELNDSIKSAQSRMKEISEQKKAILSYRRTKDIYQQFRESGWSPAFYREHSKEIEDHKQAQAVYTKYDGRLPTLTELSEEYDRLLEQKREYSSSLQTLKRELTDLWHIKTNVDTIIEDEHEDEIAMRREEQKDR